MNLITATIKDGKIEFSDEQQNVVSSNDAWREIQRKAIQRGIRYLASVLFLNEWNVIVHKPITLDSFSVTQQHYTLNIDGEQTIPIPIGMLFNEHQAILQTAISDREQKYRNMKMAIEEEKKRDTKQYWVDKFLAGELDTTRYNWCVSGNCVYIMGEGAEQKVARWETDSEKQAIADIESFGVKHWIYI